VFSSDDTYASVVETTWHPVLQEPLIESSPSVLPGGGTRATIYDYDDPAAPGDDPLIPNEAPTTRLYSRTDQGYTLDASGAVVLASYKASFTYDNAGHVTSESGPRPENYTEHSYDAVTGYRTATRRYLNGPGSSYLETSFSDFDVRGNPQTITDPNGHATTYTYDTAGRVKTVTPPFTGASSTISFTYDLDGNLTRVDFPPDSFAQPYFLRFGYDTQNRLTFLADSATNAIVYERTNGRVTREALYSGFVDLANRGTLKGDSTFSYDVAGRLLKAFNPLFGGNTVFTQYGSDANSNPTSITDENGKPDTRLYDALDRLTQVSQIRGGTTYVTQFGYDVQGNVKTVTDPAAKLTDHQHDDFGRLVKVTSPNTGVTLYVYDAAGNLVSRRENFTGSPRTTNYAYDGLDRLTLVDFPTDADWVFTYDTSAALNQKGRLASVTNGIVQTDREYTERGDLALERTTIGGVSYAVAYGYDAGGNLTAVQAPSGMTASYAYSGGRPKTLTVTAGADQRTVTNIAFAPFGGRTRADFPPYDPGTGLNTVLGTRTYNLRGQVAALQVTSPAGTVLDQSFDYAYTVGGAGPVDPGPNLDKLTDNRDPSESRFYFYDALDRLWKSTTLAGTPLYTYTYDANGNRTQETGPSGATSTSYEPGTDRIAQATGANAKYYAHDAYGSRIWAGPTPYAGLPSHVYNDLNRLVEVRDPTTQALLGQYTYDAFGRRVRKITASGTTLFFYDASGQLVEERVLAAPNAVRDYAWIEEEPVGTVDTGAQPTTFASIHTDRLGTPLAVTSSPATGNAATIWRASYAPFGLATVNEDPDGDLQLYAMERRLPGQTWDQENASHDNTFRTYDPALSRYLEADPIGQKGGLNLYAYVENDPLNHADPLGLTSFRCRKPLDALGGPTPGSGTRSGPDFSFNPLYHQYICVATPAGVACGGQTAAGSGLTHMYNQGLPSEDHFDPLRCEPTGPPDDCVDQCLLFAFKGKRPYYGLVGPGSNCQEWSNDVLSICEDVCRSRKK
jgi:RHS repeat-associated protein